MIDRLSTTAAHYGVPEHAEGQVQVYAVLDHFGFGYENKLDHIMMADPEGNEFGLL
jgi:hypothetical protein